MTAKTIAVVGAGIAGRLCARSLRQAGFVVTLFEQSARHSQKACSFVAAGLLTPLAEAANGDPAIATLGLAGLKYWQDLANYFADPDLIDLNGSVSLSYMTDQAEFREFERNLQIKGIAFRTAEAGADLREPDLDQDHLGYHIIPGEGRVDTGRMMKRLHADIEAAGVTCQFSARVTSVLAKSISIDGNQLKFDHVIDCRGHAAGTDLKDLRGVRGEVIHLHAPEVRITRPVRVLHPRLPAYIVPRADHEYVVGATSIESEDNGPITVKSTLELLNSVYNLHHGFRYASVIGTAAACRPAFSDNLPRIICHRNNGLIRLNGLYRHGFLLGPMFAAAVTDIVKGLPVNPAVTGSVHESGETS
jgi:glycine oxidase